jgi:uncharacterized membrane protein YgaE (UPF0421/DUF939 family)
MAPQDALINEVGGSAFVFGYSSGAVLALNAAAKGVAISKLVLFEAPVEGYDGSLVNQLTELITAGRRGDAGIKLKVRALKRNSSILQLCIVIAKIAAASALSWELAKLAGSKHPFLAPVSVILCMQTTILQSLLFSYHRLFGTILGVCITVLAAKYLPFNGWISGILLVLTSFFALIFERNENWIRQVALSVALVFALQKQSGLYAVDRIRDTVIGVATAMIIFILIYPPNYLKDAEGRLNTLTDRVSKLFDQLALWVGSGCQKDQGESLQSQIQSIQNEWLKANKDMKKTSDSLKFNPFKSKSQCLLKQNEKLLEILRHGIAFLDRTLYRMTEWSLTSQMTVAEQSVWEKQFQKISSYWGKSGSTVPSLEPQLILADKAAPFIYQSALYMDTCELLMELRVTP